MATTSNTEAAATATRRTLRASPGDLPWISLALHNHLAGVERDYLAARRPSLGLVTARLQERFKELDRYAVENAGQTASKGGPAFVSAYRVVARCLKDGHALMPELKTRATRPWELEEIDAIQIMKKKCLDTFGEFKKAAEEEEEGSVAETEDIEGEEGKGDTGSEDAS